MKELVEEIKRRVDIVEFISQYVQLKKRGSNYFGLCPFHHEKTPSFSVNPKGGFFHCFGCGESGDVITFLMKIENLDFKDAVKELARRYNIPISFEEKSIYDDLVEIHRIAADYFKEKLFANSVALEYLKSRYIEKEHIEEYGLGYAPESSELEKLLKSKGFSEEQLLKSGIFVNGYKGLFNRFSGRVIFPIFDESGRVIAFGGRILTNDKTKAKYLNSPETPIFSKQKVLFGLNWAKQKIRETKEVIITEGYMDCLRLHIVGIKNATATLGTALSKFHLSTLSKYAEKIYLNYDSDEAGFRAMVRSAPIVLSSKLKPFVVVLKKGEDPDSFILNNSKEAYLDRVKNSKEYFDYLIEFLKTKYNIEDPSEKLKAIEEIKPIILSVFDPVVRAAYMNKAANIFKVSESIFSIRSASFSFLSSITKQDAFLSIILKDIELMGWIEDFDEFADNLDGLYKTLYFKLVNFYLTGEEFDLSEFEKGLSEDERRLCYKLLSLTQTDIEERFERRKVLLYLIAQFKIERLKKMLNEIKEKLKSEPTKENITRYNEIFKELKGVLNGWADS
ncbi:DNA primase [Hippea alviniae]|uniref:DNA primase n=1 Tax=Hippea alviniae TaxID=1279027 RepID=UPI0003B3EBFF|nr:DNA primase [Hippea alviniae]